jgi:hypothetical protein
MIFKCYLRHILLLLAISVKFYVNESRITELPLCVPILGHSALLIGQDYFSITNYSSVLHHHIFGTMSYTALRSKSSGNLGGLRYPVNYGSGKNYNCAPSARSEV